MEPRSALAVAHDGCTVNGARIRIHVDHGGHLLLVLHRDGRDEGERRDRRERGSARSGLD